jgi:hypothetical protein
MVDKYPDGTLLSWAQPFRFHHNMVSPEGHCTLVADIRKLTRAIAADRPHAQLLRNLYAAGDEPILKTGTVALEQQQQQQAPIATNLEGKADLAKMAAPTNAKSLPQDSSQLTLQGEALASFTRVQAQVNSELNIAHPPRIAPSKRTKDPTGSKGREGTSDEALSPARSIREEDSVSRAAAIRIN